MQNVIVKQPHPQQIGHKAISVERLQQQVQHLTSIKTQSLTKISNTNTINQNKQNKISYNNGYHYCSNSNSRLLQSIISRDLMSNQYSDFIPSSSIKHSNQVTIVNNCNTTNKFNKLHKDFGHLDQLLQIKHHRENSQQSISCKKTQLRHHKISNIQSSDKSQDTFGQQIQEKTHTNNHQSSINTQNNKQVSKFTQKTPKVQSTINHQPLHQHPNPIHPSEFTLSSHANQQQLQYIQMIIQLDKSNSLILKVHINDDPLYLAKKFCYQHNIDPKIINTLAKQIKQLQFTTWMDTIINNNSNNKKENNILKPNKTLLYNNSSQASLASIKTIPNNDTYEQQNHKNSSISSKNKENKQHHTLQQPQIAPLSNINTSRKVNMVNNTNTKANSRVQYINTTNNTSIAINASATNNTNSEMRSNASIISNTTNNNNNNNNSNNNNNNNNVFDRLYKNSQKIVKKQQVQRCKQKILQSQQQLRNYCGNQDKIADKSKQSIVLNQSATFINNLSNENINNSSHIASNKGSKYQLKIYEKNTRLQKQSQNRIHQIKQQIQALQQQQYTRNPLINPVSKLIVQKLRQNEQSTCINITDDNSNLNRRTSYTRLYDRRVKKDKNIEKIIQQIRGKQEKEMKQCTFHPTISQKSKYQSVNASRYLLLHEDFYIRQNKAQSIKTLLSKQICEKQHPHINKISRKLVGTKSFDDRMAEYKINASRRKTKLQKQIKQRYRPKINKNADNKKQRNMSIGDHLYSKCFQRKSNITKSQSKLTNKLITNKSSNAMYQQMKRNAFRYIFAIMDSDQDGMISSLKINILDLDTQILQLLAPLLCQMQQDKIEFDQNRFIQTLSRLFNIYSIHQKNIILNIYRNQQKKQLYANQPSFHPLLNQKSIQIAKQIRQHGICLYQLGKEQLVQKQTKLQQLRALKNLLEFQQCTFHPNLFHYHH